MNRTKDDIWRVRKQILIVTKKVINQKFYYTNMLIFSKKLDSLFQKIHTQKALENIYHFQEQWFLEPIDIARILTEK